MADSRFYTQRASLSLADICALAGLASPEGSLADVAISDCAPMDAVGAGLLTFLSDAKQKSALDTCRAEAVLVHPDLAGDVAAHGMIALQTPHPRAVFSTIMRSIYHRKTVLGQMEAISSDASIEEGVEIGYGAVIGAHAVIRRGAKIHPHAVIGPGCHIGAHADIRAQTSVQCADVGEGVTLHEGVKVGGDGFGIAPGADGPEIIPHIGGVTIGNGASIGCNTTIDRAMFGVTSIGANTHIDNLCMIAHNVTIGNNCMFAALVGIPGSVTIGDGVILAGQVGIADHVTIGNGATVTGHSGVMHDIPNGETWGGYPAQPIRGHLREVAMLRKLAKKGRAS